MFGRRDRLQTSCGHSSVHKEEVHLSHKLRTRDVQCCGSRKMKRTNLCGTVLIVFVLIAAVIVDGQMLNDYPQISRPEMKRSISGINVRLKCTTEHCTHPGKFHWEFQACSPELFKPKCQNTDTGKWQRIPGSLYSSKSCSSDFLLQNVSVNNNGLYRCSFYNDHYMDVREVKTYEVDVIEKIRYDNGNPPKVDVYPFSAIILQHTKLAIQCKVHSTVPPTIMWFKQLDSPTSNVGLNYNNRTYVKLSSSPQFKLYDDTYLSKLIFENVSGKDSGIYKCLAVNIFGKTDEDFFVTVTLNTEDPWEPSTTSFSLLFLIPVSLLMIPIIAWLCYYRKKFKYRPVGNPNLLPKITISTQTSQNV